MTIIFRTGSIGRLVLEWAYDCALKQKQSITQIKGI